MPTTRLPITPTLVASIGALLLLAVGSVLWIEWNASRQILATLGGRVVDRNVSQLEQGIAAHLDPARRAVANLGRRIESGEYSLDEPERLAVLLNGAIEAAPQIGLLVFADADGRALRLLREPDSGHLRVERVDAKSLPELEAALREAAGKTQTYWGKVVHNVEFGVTLINVRQPLHRNGTYLGVLAAAVTVRELSHLVADLRAESGLQAFVLLGHDRVLAHEALQNGHPEQTFERPLVTRSQLGDPVLAALERATPSAIVELDPARGEFLELRVDGIEYFVMRRQVTSYGERPVVIGSYRPASEVNAPIRLLYSAGATGLAALALALLAALALSRAIARPVRRISATAAQVGDLAFEQVEDIERSAIREIDDLAQAFNRMLVGLRSFGTYVPRSLVARLLRQQGDADVISEERELTVLFTDIAGFTSMCEGMDAREVADFLNEHLALLADCVERTDGTIDKYIGDALMAFWGAPERLANSAAAACRAAREMARAITNDNLRRHARGLAPIRLRIGIHTGPLVVGNIGAPSRINYTVVGDTVNTAQRLESLGKEFQPDAQVCILISDETRSHLPDDFTTERAGSFHVKGKEVEVEVYQLLPDLPPDPKQ